MGTIQLVILKTKIVRKPYSGEITGMRIQATYPNKEARVIAGGGTTFYATQQQTTSFNKKYLVTESSDCLNDFELVKTFKKFAQTLKDFYGFTHWQMAATKKNPNPEIVKL